MSQPELPGPEDPTRGPRGFRGRQGREGEPGPPSTDDELLAELKKVGSSVAFRIQVRRILRFIGVVAAVALVASIISVVAFFAVRRYQQEACDRDNALRKAYVDQWGPILKDSPPPEVPPEGSPPEVVEAYERQVQQRATFEKSLEGFAQHPC